MMGNGEIMEIETSVLRDAHVWLKRAKYQSTLKDKWDWRREIILFNF